MPTWFEKYFGNGILLTFHKKKTVFFSSFPFKMDIV